MFEHGMITDGGNAKRTCPLKKVPVNKWGVLAILALCLSIIVLDGTIVGVSLPTIITDLKLNLVDAQWVTALYAVVFAGLLLSSGVLADKIGRTRTLSGGLILFVVGSWIAMYSTEAVHLVLSRAIQGVGGALIMPATLSSVNALFQGKDRAAAFGVWGATMAGVAAIGPLLGGYITTYFSWPLIFGINVPIGILLFLAVRLWVPETRAEHTTKYFDIPGALLSALGFGTLVFGLIEGDHLGWIKPAMDFNLGAFTWSESWALSLPLCSLIAGLILITSFILWEKHRLNQQKEMLLNLELFKISSFSWGNLTACMVAIAEFMIIFALPLYLINCLAMDAMGAGFVLAGMAAGAFVSGAMARHLAARFSQAWVVLIGLALEFIGIIACAFSLTSSSPAWFVACLLLIYGVGMGLAAAQLTSTVLREVPVMHSGMGSATQSTVRQLGSALGSALAGSFLAVALTHDIPKHLSTVAGLPQQTVDMLTSTTTDSAGGLITALQHIQSPSQLQAMHLPFGFEQLPGITSALSSSFSSGVSFVLLIAAGFLAVGVVGSIFVMKAEAHLQDLASPDGEKSA